MIAVKSLKHSALDLFDRSPIDQGAVCWDDLQKFAWTNMPNLMKLSALLVASAMSLFIANAHAGFFSFLQDGAAPLKMATNDVKPGGVDRSDI